MPAAASPATPAPPPAPAPAPRGAAAFARRAALFWAPFVIVAAVFEAALWRSGESWPVKRTLEAQARDAGAIALRGLLDQSFYAYKHAGLRRARPRVLALGSSRVMKFRAAMFGADAPRFYNAGGLVVNVEDLVAFADALARAEAPAVVLLGVDMWWLNAARPAEDGFSRGIHEDGARSWQGHVLAWRELLRRSDMLRATLPALAPGAGTARRIGLQARLHGEGFRHDGSLESGLPVPADARGWRFVDRERPTVARRIRRGVELFEPTHGVAPARVARLRRGLLRLRGRGCLVVGFAPPVYSGAAALLEQDERHRRLWREYREVLPRLFAALDMPYVDASTPARLGLDDRYLLDGFHPEETFLVHLLRRMLQDPRVAGALPTAGAAVERALASPRTNYWHADLGGARR